MKYTVWDKLMAESVEGPAEKKKFRTDAQVNRSIGIKSSHARPDVKAQMKASAKEVGARPDVRAKRRAAQKLSCNRPEIKSKRSVSAKITWTNPSVKAMRSVGIKAALDKPCTVDGITIYPSMSALKLALGQGKNGYRSPNFRYLPKGTKPTV